MVEIKHIYIWGENSELKEGNGYSLLAIIVY